MKAHNQILINLQKSKDNSLDEATKWKHIAGPRYKHMDQVYEQRIDTKLFPILRNYGINMLSKPIEEGPGNVIYIGRDENDKRVTLEFINRYEPGLQNRIAKYDMFVKVTYNGKTENTGIIDLSSKDYVDQAFSLITMTLEDLSNENKHVEKEPEEDNQELEDLAKFKQGLSEQEILEIEVV